MDTMSVELMLFKLDIVCAHQFMSNTPENNKCQYHFMRPTCEINDHASVSVDELVTCLFLHIFHLRVMQCTELVKRSC